MRLLGHPPGFTATAVLTLAAGIAGSVAMVSVYSRVVLHPVTAREPARLVAVRAINPSVDFVPPTLSWPRFQAIADAASASLEKVAAYGVESVHLSGDGGAPEPLRALRVTPGFFELLGTVPARGRLFRPEDDLPNGPRVCVLAHELWQARFGGRDLVGVTIELDQGPTEVIGVLPPRFSPPWSERQIFLPRVYEDSGLTPQAVAHGASFLEVVARLREGATRERAAAELDVVSRQYAERFAGHGDAANRTEVLPFVDTVVGDRRPVLAALLGAVLLALLIACANVAALFLGRVVSRQRELAVRQALGASRAVLVRQILGESLALSAVAGVVGVLLALGLLTFAQWALAAQLPPGVRLRLDAPAALAAVGIVLLCSLLVGAAPAALATRPTSTARLGGSARGLSDGAATRRLRAALVVVETALSVLLLGGAGLLLLSLHRLHQTSPGFEPAGVAAAISNLAAPRYDEPERQIAYFVDLVERLRRAPQVTGAAVVFGLPFHDENYAHTFAVAGRPVPPTSERLRAGARAVSEGYFEVMRIRLLAGRTFTAADRDGAERVCIVNESLARRLFGAGSAIDQVILRGRAADRAHRIVGVVADVKTGGLRAPTPDEVYYPFRQVPRPQAAIVARTGGDPADLAPAFRAAALEVDPAQPVARFATMERRLAGTLGGERLMAGLATAFAALALLLAAIGLYAVLAHGVTTRRAEFGIRMAIGAGRREIVRLVLAEGLRLVAAGVGAGLVAALSAAGVLAAHLHAVEPREPWIFGVVVGVFLVVGGLASWLPASRAARVDPVIALRVS